MDFTQLKHELTGVPFHTWLNDPNGLIADEAIGLIKVRCQFEAIIWDIICHK
jgi:hypothetical protein